MKGMAAIDKTTYARYKAAIRRRFLTEYDPVHINSLVWQCTMKPDETTKDYVTWLWALVAQLTDMSDEWKERTILTALHMGHARLEVRDLLIKDNPKTIPAAERICEEYEVRQQTLPVTMKFVNAMVSSGATAAAVDNVT
jgi:hypothetical protein